MEGKFGVGKSLELTEERIETLIKDLIDVMKDETDERGINIENSMEKVVELGKSLRPNENAFLLFLFVVLFWKNKWSTQYTEKSERAVTMMAGIHKLTKGD